MFFSIIKIFFIIFAQIKRLKTMPKQYEQRESEARKIVNLIANSQIGLISYDAKQSIMNCTQSEFLQKLYEQLAVNDPNDTLKKLGEELSMQIISFVER